MIYHQDDIPAHLREYFEPAPQLGLEATPAEYVARMVEVFREVRRVLRDDGTLWLNLGDSYVANGSNQVPQTKQHVGSGLAGPNRNGLTGLKPKDLCGIPWRVAFALQADGWYLRQDIIWCLSGGVAVYARTQKGDMPMTLKDMARLNPSTVKLWNGERWTQLLGMSKAKRRATELTLVLRSGERISCTPTHKFPTARGLLDASRIKVGDRLTRVRLPEPDDILPTGTIGSGAAWFAGLYLAEGSMAGDTIQIAGHAKETKRWERLKRIAATWGGSATRTVNGNNMSIRLYGKMLVALVSEFVSGKTAVNKHIAPAVWRYGDGFLANYIRGYLDGDGHWDAKNERWRLGFCRNYSLEQDLRTACARLGYTLTLNPGTSRYQGGERPSFKGELRMTRAGHGNERSRDEVVRIERSRCRFVYEVGVADDPHTFALASGILSHNSKPNPMPESVRDRCTKSHEYLFLMSKSERYYFDNDAIKEDCVQDESRPSFRGGAYVNNSTFDNSEGGKSTDTGNVKRVRSPAGWKTGDGAHGSIHSDGREQEVTYAEIDGSRRNKRSVWTVATQPYAEAHFATFPPKLIEPCVLAGCPVDGVVLDPFAGSATSGEVALKLGRRFVGIELSETYFNDLALPRIENAQRQNRLFA